MSKRSKAWSGGGALAFLLSMLMLAAACLAASRATSASEDGKVVLPPRPAWAPGVGIGVRDLVGDHGRILAAIGDFERPGYFGAARFSAAGALQTGFGAGGYTRPLHVHHGPGLRLRGRAVATQGGRVLVAGFQETELGGTAPLLARYRSNGTLDRAFGHGGIVAPKPATEDRGPGDPNFGIRGGGTLQDVAVQPGGRIVAVGARNESGGGAPAALVVAYRRDGSLDTGFGNGGRVVIATRRENRFTGFTSVRVLPDRRILVAGYVRGALALMRLTAEGDPDPGFGDGDGIITPSAGQPRYCCPTPALLGFTDRGRIVLGGAFNRFREEPLLLFRLRRDGSVDRAFGTKGHVSGSPRGATAAFTPFSLAVQGDGRIVVAGLDERVDRDRRIHPVFTALRYLADGKVDRGFGDGGAATLPSSDSGGAAAAALVGRSVVVGGGIFLAPRRTIHIAR